MVVFLFLPVKVTLLFSSPLLIHLYPAVSAVYFPHFAALTYIFLLFLSYNPIFFIPLPHGFLLWFTDCCSLSLISCSFIFSQPSFNEKSAFIFYKVSKLNSHIKLFLKMAILPEMDLVSLAKLKGHSNCNGSLVASVPLTKKENPIIWSRALC